MEKRRFPRHFLKEPVSYQMREDFPLSGALSSDLSEGGVRIRIQDFVALNTVLELKLHLNDPLRVVAVKGKVVWVRQVAHSEHYDVGIRFLEGQNLVQAFEGYLHTPRF